MSRSISKSRKRSVRRRNRKPLKAGSRLRAFQRIAPDVQDETLSNLVRAGVQAFLLKDYDDYSFFRGKAESKYGVETTLNEFIKQTQQQTQTPRRFGPRSAFKPKYL